jgi:hypothetical protein
MEDQQALTQVEFDEYDFPKAEAIANALGAVLSTGCS